MSNKTRRVVVDAVSGGALVLAVLGYRIYPETAWTEIADMALRSWSGLLLFGGLVLWSTLHFEHIRDLILSPDILETIGRYNQKRLKEGSIISYNVAAIFAIYLGLAYVAADARRYGIAAVVMIFLGLIALALRDVGRIFGGKS